MEKHHQSCVCFNLRKAARVITQIYDEAMRPLGFRSTQLTILHTVKSMEPVTVSQLAQATLTDRTTLTRNFKPLEKKGYLLIQSGEDRRERVVVLTGKGRKILLKAYPLWEKAQQKIVRTVGSSRLNQLLKELSDVMLVVQKKR